MAENFLRSILAGESRAYGFTIAFWGSGALLINHFGLPGLGEALSYGFGAVTGFGILALIAFRYAFGPVDYEEPRYLVFSMIHYTAALLPVLFTGIIARNLSSPVMAFFLSGLSVSITYNLAMLLERTIGEEARQLEDVFVKLV